MTLRVNVAGGTGAGIRAPYTDGHAPGCACSRCTADRGRGVTTRTWHTDDDPSTEEAR